MTKTPIPHDLDYAAKHMRWEFRAWHDDGMFNDLGDLLRLLQDVEDEMSRFDGDALLVDHWDELSITTDYVTLFGDPDDHDSDWPLTFDYRLGNVEEDISYVESLVEGLGDSFQFDNLPKRKYLRDDSTVA